MRPNSMRTARIIGVSEILFAAGIILFWIEFFVQDPGDFSDSRFEEIYLTYEKSFPAADGLLAVLLVCGGVGLWRRARAGWFFSVISGSMLIFLGMLDVSFNLRQGIYRLSPENGLLNLGLNASCLAGGVFYVWSAWKFGLKGAAR